jgi:Flp pilus assembly protein TadG
MLGITDQRPVKRGFGDATRVQRRGVMLVWFIIVLAALMALLSLGVDLGRVQLAKTELQQAADAAARYAATGIQNGSAVSRAIEVANQNRADGTAVVITASDVVLGNWDDSLSPKFSPSRTPINAVQITAARTASRGNPVPLMFAKVLGASTCDVQATSIATCDLGITSGFIALTNFAVKNNLHAYSYDSSVDPNPSQTNHKSSGMIGSNGAITAKNNEVVGEVVLGPSGSHNLALDSPARVLTQPIPTPAIDFSGAPASNPNGTPQNYTVGGTVTLPAGTYHFSSLTLNNNANLKFAGPSTVYVDGDVSFAQNGSIAAYNDIPGNLKIRQRGAGSSFGGANANSVDITADVEAPQTALHAKNRIVFKGRGTFNTIDAKNSAEFFYDERLQATIPGVTAPGGAICTVR